MKIEDEDLRDDILTHYDFHRNNYVADELLPEKQLMYSVLTLAIVDYLSSSKKTHYKTAKKWLYDDENTDYIYAFHNICFTMGIDPIRFRRDLQILKKKKVKFALDGKRINHN